MTNSRGAVDDEGEVLDILVHMHRNKHAALKVLRRLLKNQGIHPETVTTDKLASYRANRLSPAGRDSAPNFSLRSRLLIKPYEVAGIDRLKPKFASSAKIPGNWLGNWNRSALIWLVFLGRMSGRLHQNLAIST